MYREFYFKVYGECNYCIQLIFFLRILQFKENEDIACLMLFMAAQFNLTSNSDASLKASRKPFWNTD